MDGAKKRLDALITLGEGFTYDNFAQLEPQKRWALTYAPEWIAWTTRVNGVLTAMFAADTAPIRMLKAAHAVTLVGNGPDKFADAMSHYLSALQEARKILDEDTYGELAENRAQAPMAASNRVFVVHGRDDKSKAELEIILTEMGLEPVVLHRQPDGGKTLIEKFEHYADVGYAFIILTPDEIAYLADEEAKPDGEREKEYRARPNAIFEFGFFVGRLGRSRTCCVYKSPVTIPSDLSGLVYKRFESSMEEVAYSIGKELKAAGYKLR